MRFLINEQYLFLIVFDWLNLLIKRSDLDLQRLESLTSLVIIKKLKNMKYMNSPKVSELSFAKMI